MKIGGWQKVSLIDYPGKICTILFTQGCNFRCPYCHNPELVEPSLFQPCYDEETVFQYLEKRKGILDAVSITGGEPSLQADLASWMQRIKEMGYLTKLDTNGSHPQVLRELLDEKLLDYIAMDIKGPLDRYAEITRAKIDVKNVLSSIDTIMASGIPYEFRTTVVNSLLSNGDFEKIGEMIQQASCYVLQKYIPSKPLDPSFVDQSPPSDDMLLAVKESLSDKIDTVLIR